MREGKVTIINPLGLHARAAAQLVRLAGTFQSKIVIIRMSTGVYADAKSILNVLTLAAAFGTVLGLTAEGSDEDDAFEAIERLFANGFGEI
jgi:phosphotransferase system HPr (HPr) family protein